MKAFNESNDFSQHLNQYPATEPLRQTSTPPISFCKVGSFDVDLRRKDGKSARPVSDIILLLKRLTSLPTLIEQEANTILLLLTII